MEYVYLMRKGSRIKIGKSRNPQQRFNYLRYSGGAEELLWTLPCEDYTNTERALHARFWRVRGAGEYFDLTSEDVEWIMSQTEAGICEGFDAKKNSTWSRGFLSLLYWEKRSGG